ncbi:uncharacterized protein DSM5745_00728 [Aspergillus mulundensis]|uniref:Uncharacterized protein n=1 Tax=Aspergillus mulundensis TaxID=1810919 RepID=A0A3D8T4C4_9EURO|nr:hypothetical protein DSM5745_00728 [Aspergillus mulundensis]RDW93406.1 hypothetical protein DSM5745_00728 [Aspergillus mulundensis]
MSGWSAQKMFSNPQAAGVKRQRLVSEREPQEQIVRADTGQVSVAQPTKDVTEPADFVMRCIEVVAQPKPGSPHRRLRGIIEGENKRNQVDSSGAGRDNDSSSEETSDGAIEIMYDEGEVTETTTDLLAGQLQVERQVQDPQVPGQQPMGIQQHRSKSELAIPSPPSSRLGSVSHSSSQTNRDSNVEAELDKLRCALLPLEDWCAKLDARFVTARMECEKARAELDKALEDRDAALRERNAARVELNATQADLDKLREICGSVSAHWDVAKGDLYKLIAICDSKVGDRNKPRYCPSG